MEVHGLKRGFMNAKSLERCIQGIQMVLTECETTGSIPSSVITPEAYRSDESRPSYSEESPFGCWSTSRVFGHRGYDPPEEKSRSCCAQRGRTERNAKKIRKFAQPVLVHRQQSKKAESAC